MRCLIRRWWHWIGPGKPAPPPSTTWSLLYFWWPALIQYRLTISLKKPPTKSQTPPRHPMTNFNPGDSGGGLSSPTLPTQWRVWAQPPKDHPALHLGPAWSRGTCGSAGTWVSNTPQLLCFFLSEYVECNSSTVFSWFRLSDFDSFQCHIVVILIEQSLTFTILRAPKFLQFIHRFQNFFCFRYRTIHYICPFLTPAVTVRHHFLLKNLTQNILPSFPCF